ncbi:MAG: hypothetical protein HN790_17070 [Methylococcales bacterium]|jgi:asparagine synthase (glutamine-hydrolysing)|nr:hypothetical protein [Methylococcales bacterium]
MDNTGNSEQAVVSCLRMSARLPWRKLSDNHCVVWGAGAEQSLVQIQQLVSQINLPSNSQKLYQALQAVPGHFAIIIEGDGWVLACVDRVRSHVIVYQQEKDQLQLSNDIKAFGVDDVNRDSLLELQMANYVSGSNTIFKSVQQLQPGECLLWDKQTKKTVVHCYQPYFSEQLLAHNRDDLMQQQIEVTDRVFQRVVDHADGRTIWIPLSGGLDSRLVLCLLKSKGYDNIRTFSYGPPGNYDAKWAKIVAEKVGVPWAFIPYSNRIVNKYFWSDKRKDYWQFASNGCSIPFMSDEVAFDYMIRNKIFNDPEGSVVVNGQSGDFISGGHISGYHLQPLEAEKLYDISVIIDAIIKKHYSLNKKVLSKTSDWLSDRIHNSLGIKGGEYSGQHLIKLYEQWECSERQSRYVVNGQRSYDYYGIDWSLPLWDLEMFEFWKQVPSEFKFDQNLYKEYLVKQDFMGMFKDFKSTMWNWQGAGFMVFPIAKMIGLIAGQSAKAQFYELTKYFGKYSHHYAPFGFWHHAKTMKYYNGPLGRYPELLIREQQLE